MIFDNFKNAHIYCACHPKFQQAFEFIKKVFDENLPAGRYDLDGELLYAFVQEYSAKFENEGVLESHKNYIDIQCLVSGSELMEVVDISVSEEKTAYNADNDIAFWNDSLKALRAVFETGDFAVFFPHDLHKPGMCVNGVPTANKKIVVKVKV